MKKLCIFLFVLFLATAPRADNLARLRKEHPRLLFTSKDQQRIEKLARRDDLLKRLIEQNQVNAEKMLGQEKVKYHIPDGKRLLGESRKCITRVASMAMAYRLSGEKRFAEGAIKEMLAAAAFKDWNPSHFLDTGEMTTALSIGYDWLYEAISPEDRETIRNAIVKHGLLAGKKHYDSGFWWTRSDNNWNQVCNGGMIIGALAIAEDEKELAEEILAHALKSIPRGVSVYPPDGAYPEGPGYWKYGTSYTCLTINALDTALGKDFGIHKSPGLDRTGLYRMHLVGPIGLYFNYADGGSRYSPSSAMFLLSLKYDYPMLAWWHRSRMEERVPEGKVTDRSQDRFFPLEIAWYDQRGKAPSAAELPLDVFFRGDQHVVTLRSKWGDPEALFVAFKGGNNQANHGHLDIGSFVLDAGGVRWAIDLGADNYNMPGYWSKNEGGKRWSYYRLNSRSHNTLIIKDQLQRAKARAKISGFESKPGLAGAEIDMSQAYAGQANKAVRRIEMEKRRSVRISDKITGAAGPVRWGMVTSAKITLTGGRATLAQDGKTLEVEIVSPPKAKFQVVSTKPPTSKEKQNEGTSMLAAVITPDQNGNIELVITMGLAGKKPR